MPIRHFDIFTAERRLIQTSAVSQLKDTRLGIEGNYWLRKILAKEPAVSAMGGSPLKLREAIEAEIKSFKTHNIQPIFVFPGLSILRKDKPFSNEDRRPSVRATGWEYYEKNRVDVALGSWSNSGGVHPADLLNQVFHILHEHGVEFMRAPYSPWAQVKRGEKAVSFVCIHGCQLILSRHWNSSHTCTATLASSSMPSTVAQNFSCSMSTRSSRLSTLRKGTIYG
ncbi:PIN domain-like protein [Syncephalastrum racemosum]|uniref:PIN domain-like protein n=1 Tax=Syncephalastrum racemosum TaxID=13706 RepID=A0A1X2HAR6_SYNRA|nr:PIN domain-like protein [Syncephalastrum racemosum]